MQVHAYLRADVLFAQTSFSPARFCSVYLNQPTLPCLPWAAFLALVVSLADKDKL